MEIKEGTTGRGFGRIDFTDRYGAACSVQKSSLATEDAIWFGVNDPDPQVCIPGEGWKPYPIPADVSLTTRMHLTREQVAELLPILQRFVATGELTKEKAK